MSDYTFAEQHEYNTAKLLKKLGFNNVKGGPGNIFKLGGNQIDVSGTYDGKLILIECTTQKSNLKSKIEQWKGKRGQIIKGLQQKDKYKKYAKPDKVRFIFHSYYKKAINYKDFAGEDPAIYIWGPKLRNYYEELAKNIPSRAIYDLYTDLGFKRNQEEEIEVSAFRWKFKNTIMYNFYISPSHMIKISYVARRKTGRKDYYQRMVNPSRLKSIKNNFLYNDGIFPNNIVVNIKDDHIFDPSSIENADNLEKGISVGKLTFQGGYDSCWVIDGQHRLFSFEDGMPQKISVVAFSDIDAQQQMQYFVEINKNAKPVKSELIWDMESDLNPSGTKGLISLVVKKLNTADPFKNSINIPSQNNGDVSLTAFCTSIEKTGLAKDQFKIGIENYKTDNPLYYSNSEDLVDSLFKYLSIYFKILKDLTDKSTKDNEDYLEEFILRSAGGVSVFIYLFQKILSAIARKPNKKILKKYCGHIVDFLKKQGKSGVDGYKKNTSSEAKKTDVLQDFLKVLDNTTDDTDNRFKRFIKSNLGIKDEVVEFEVNLRNALKKSVQKIHDGEEITDKKLNKLLGQDKLVKKYKEDDLTIGDLEQAIINSNMWKKFFKEIFIRTNNHSQINELRFPKESIFRAKFEYLVETRNNLLHSNIKISRHDKTEISNFIIRCKSILEDNNLIS
jgi:DGQHR domain-containing protein